MANPACGIKIFMGSQQGRFLIDDGSLDPIFGVGDTLDDGLFGGSGEDFRSSFR
jgi:hypothetical protein